MPYPSRYYFKAHSSITTYAYEGEVICIDELLDGKEKVYYESQPSGEETSPKVLIFNDWSASTWSPYKIMKIKELLQELLQNQFQIYYPRWGQWVAFSAKSLDLQIQDYSANVKATNNDELCHAAMRDLKIPLKQLLCLDYFEMHHLWDPDYDPSLRRAFSSDIGNKQWETYSSIKAELIEQWQITVVEDTLNTQIDEVPDTTIRHLQLGGYTFLRENGLQIDTSGPQMRVYGKDQQRKTPILSAVTTVTVTNGDEQCNVFLQHAFGTAPNQIECLQIIRPEVSLETVSVDWSRLKMLSYQSYYHEHSRYDTQNTNYLLTHLFVNTPKLTHAKIDFGDRNVGPVLFRFASTLLESFALSGKYANLEEIFSILDQNPKLQRLEIEPCGMTSNAPHSEWSTRPHALKILRLRYANTSHSLSGAEFGSFLSRLPQLQELIFSRLSLQSSVDFRLAPGALPNLKHIAFQLSNVDHDRQLCKCLPTLLAAAPNLESFEMWPGGNIVPTTDLRKLKKVTWFGTLGPTSLNRFMACAPNVQSVTIIYHFQDEQYRKLGNIIPLTWQQTDFAEYLSITEIDLNGWGDRSQSSWEGCNTAEAILRQCPNLEIVRIDKPQSAPAWLRALCTERDIKLLGTACCKRDTGISEHPEEQPNNPVSSATITAVEAVQHAQPVRTAWMDRYFRHQQEERPHSLPDYLRTLTQGEGRNQLIYLDNRGQLNALLLQLEEYCNALGQPLYIANEPRDLNCSSRHMRREGHRGYVESGRGGRMVQFIDANAQPAPPLPPIVVINNDNFEPADNVRFNSIYDPIPIRKADKERLPPSFIVLVFMNLGNPKTYKKSDLLSRFAPKYRKHCPLPEPMLLEGLPQPIVERPANLEQAVLIEFFGQSNWKSHLEGTWILRDQWMWEEGIANTSLQTGQPIVLHNLNVEDPNFQYYWTKKSLHHQRTTGQPVTTYSQNGYDWEALSQVLTPPTEKEISGPYLLNPKYLAKFFKHYQANDPKMDRIEGWVQTNAGKHLRVYQTAAISLGNKARLFAECLKYNVTLEIYDAQLTQSSQVDIIQSMDVDLTLEQRRSDAEIVIDISEVEPSQLLGKTTPSFDEVRQTYVFHTSDSFLLKELNAGKRIILKGQFSPVLIDNLALLIVFASFPGQLILLSDINPGFEVFENSQVHHVSVTDKEAALLKQYPSHTEIVTQLIQDCPSNEPYIRLQHRMRYILRNMATLANQGNLYEFSNKNWYGIDRIDDDMPTLPEDEDVMAHRTREITSILRSESIIVVLGKTETGKSESIKRLFPRAYYGLDAIPAWLEAAKHGLALWVEDEANVSPSNWTKFDDLPHGLFHGSTYYRLTKTQAENARVMLIGNPFSYGGERKIATLFLRRGNTCIFDPLPAHFIENNILRPLFAGIDLDQNAILDVVLRAYVLSTKLPSHRVLMGPREMCTMVLLTICTALEYPDESVRNIAYFFSYHMTKTITYEQHARAFTNAFPDLPNWEPRIEHTIASSDFLLTDSRKIVLQFLEAFLRLRRFKQQPGRTKEQKISGLNVFSLVGEPAQGKSVLLDSVFPRATADIDYTHIPVRMPIETYLHAFRNGLAVRRDEGNTVALSEEKMNSLSSGYDYETQQISPNPGYMVFASENPITLGGDRRAMSNAEERRALTWIVLNYTFDELCQIAEHHGMSRIYVDAFVTKFQQTVRHQLVNDETPWTVRELVALVKEASKDHAITIQTAVRRFAQRHTIFNLREAQRVLREQQMRDQKLHEQSLRDQRLPEPQARVQQQVPPVLPPHRPPTSQSSWLIRFLPELTGALLFLAGLTLLWTSLPVAVATSLCAIGIGIFAVGRMRSRVVRGYPESACLRLTHQ